MNQNDSKPVQVAVIGTGYISDIHMQVLSIFEDVHVCAVCDLDIKKAEALQKKWNVPHVFCSIDDLLGKLKPDVAHIIVPPPFHAEVAEKFLTAGISLFLEKPMALSVKDCKRLISLAKNKNVKIGVNHNYQYHPAYRKMLKDVKARKIGRVQNVIVFSNMPLRQLSTKDFSHWMFQNPWNIIFEQGPHPFSLIYKLLGCVSKIQTTNLGKRQLSEDKIFYDTWQISMECEKGSAQLYYAVGKEFPENWMHVIGQDGSIQIDLFNNLYSIQKKTRSEYFSSFLNSLFTSYALAMRSIANTVNYLLSLLKLKEPTDPFYAGMKGSIRAFYHAFQQGKNPPSSGEDGLAVIEYCEKATAHISSSILQQVKVDIPLKNQNKEADVLVIGATGFIGGHLVKALLKTNQSLRIMVRRPESIPPFLKDPRIQVFKGDITNRDTVFKAISGVSAVYHLATGTGENWEAVKRSMVGGLQNVADACIQEKVQRLFFTSTVAVYPFDGNKPITEKSPLDQYPEKRSLYCRAKIACEKMLWKMYDSFGLPITIFRPAVVVGKGGIAEHSAIGYWINDLHCIGWGSGKSPIPFVLVEDVISALLKGSASDNAIGQSFNLAGDVRLTAQEYVRHLGKVRRRRICFHPRSIQIWCLNEMALWSIKKLMGRSNIQLTTYRALKARALRTPIDSTKAKTLLDWEPNKDVGIFIKRGIECFSSPG